MVLFKDREELDLTDGPIGRNLFWLSLPIIVTNLLRTAYNLADTFWLGQLSDTALAAITFAFPLVFLLISLGIGLAVAGSVLVAQNEGAGRRERADYVASQTVGFAAVLAILLGIAGYLTLPRIVPLLGAGPEVAALATEYLRIVSLGIITMFGFSVFISLMRGHGDTVTPMLLMLATVILNIALDPVLIFGWGPFPALGVAGAAVATVFSRGLAMLAGIAILLSGWKEIQIHPDQILPDREFLGTILRIGVPASVESTGMALSVTVMTAIVGMFAKPVVAGFGVGIRIFSLVFLPADALSRGVEAMTGQNIGAERPDRARTVNRLASIYSFGLLTVIGAICYVFAGPIVAVFSPEPQVVATGTAFIRTVAFSFGFIGIIKSISGGFRGVGKTLVAALIAVFSIGILRVPLAFIGATNVGPIGVWWSFPLSNVLGAGLALVLFWWDDWEDAAVTTDEKAVAEVAEGVEEIDDTM